MHVRASFPSKMRSKHASHKGIACCPQTSITSQSLARNDPKKRHPKRTPKPQMHLSFPCAPWLLWVAVGSLNARTKEGVGPMVPGRPTMLVFFHQDSNTLVPGFLCGRHWLSSGPHQERCKQRNQSHPGVIQTERAV